LNTKEGADTSVNTTIKCLTRDEVNQVISWRYDYEAYKQAYDSTLSAFGDQSQKVANLESVVLRAGKTIDAKDDHIAFEKSKGELLAKENKKLARWNTFWRTLAGSAIFVVGVEIIKDLK
jgi:hypothetical protein